jgi:nitrite reductase/ring-hydroxylating ferredoxin subunit
MGTLVKVANADSFPPGHAACCEVLGQRIALFNVEGTFYAINDICPHSGGPLSEGFVKGTTVSCPWHGAAFNLTTGMVLLPPARQGVRSYKVVLEGNDVKVEI